MPRQLVSVIITCYNQGKYLRKAIESILAQSYSFYEIILVDDGSTDNTREVAGIFPKIKYRHQLNQGLSAARNCGIKDSTGKFVVFLDADDWLLPDAFSINIKYLNQNLNAAFVSGAHELFYEKENKSWIIRRVVTENHYCHLLESNYIGMHATVMYQRWVFDTYSFDTSVKYCEDYYLYLHIARRFAVIHHIEPIAVYRIHQSNMSGDNVGMLKFALLVLTSQEKLLLNESERACYRIGLNNWTSYYSEKIFNKFIAPQSSQKKSASKADKEVLKLYNLLLYNKLIAKERKDILKAMGIGKVIRFAKSKLPNFILKMVMHTVSYANTSNIKKINLGDLNRTTPFSKHFGYDRGGPVDRYYIEDFLQRSKSVIKGRCLEIGDNEYTLKYGSSSLTQSDIFHVDETNTKATFIGDLSDAPQIPDNCFDCIILTQTLQFIYDHTAAIQTCHRILKPGGTLLLTVPGISHIAYDEWGKFWLWSFTSNSIKKILEIYFSSNEIEIETFGNVLVATAFLYGMGLPEIKKEQMDFNDPHYQVIIAGIARKCG